MTTLDPSTLAPAYAALHHCTTDAAATLLASIRDTSPSTYASIADQLATANDTTQPQPAAPAPTLRAASDHLLWFRDESPRAELLARRGGPRTEGWRMGVEESAGQVRAMAKAADQAADRAQRPAAPPPVTPPTVADVYRADPDDPSPLFYAAGDGTLRPATIAPVLTETMGDGYDTEHAVAIYDTDTGRLLAGFHVTIPDH